MIDEILSKIKQHIIEFFGSIFTLSWVPEIYIWYFWLFLLFLLCGVIIWFFGWSKIVRIVASMTFLAGAIFVAGGQYMVWRLKARDEKKPKPKPKPQEPQGGGGIFGGWR